MRVQEIVPGVFWLALGSGLRASNVYLVASDASWALIDGGWPRDAAAIRSAADSLFGTPPAAILLTHDHPDHAGAVRELAELWDRPVLLHPRELPLALGDPVAISDFAGPLDRFAILPALRLMGSRRMADVLARASLQGLARAYDPRGPVPGLAGWDVLPTPGHTPGHVAFVRRGDGVAITGDAVVTVDLNSPRGILLHRPQVARPPWYTTWDWRAATASALAVARLAPRVLAGGHGTPLTGSTARHEVRAFLRRARL